MPKKTAAIVALEGMVLCDITLKDTTLDYDSFESSKVGEGNELV